MKKTKRFLAVVAAMAMALAPTSTFAAQSPAETTGSAANGGQLEGAIVKEYVDYVAPTVSPNSFDFVLDPQGLIAATDGKTVKGGSVQNVTTEAGVSVYFKQDDHFAVSSDALTVTNKGTSELSISVKATMGLDTTGSSINVVTDTAVVDTTSGALNLRIHLDQVSGGSATAALAKDADVTTKSALSVDVTTEAADPDDFDVTKSAAGVYSYAPTQDTTGGSVSFVFQGECNTADEADWTKVNGMTATFDVVWDIKAAGSTPTVSKTNTTATWADRTQDFTFNVDLASCNATSITDVGLVFEGKAYACNNAWGAGTQIKDFVDMTGNTIVMDKFLKDFCAESGSDTTIYIQFDNSDSKMLTITVN